MSARRVLAFLAVHGGAVYRAHAAGLLWLDVPGDRAYANLRNALWRLRRAGPGLVDGEAGQLRLSHRVSVDLRDARARAQHLLATGTVDASRLVDTGLTRELLPDWYDDWLAVERERFRQLRLHALEALGLRLVRMGELAAALETALAALAADPLRESAHRLVMTVHLAEGNGWEAIRQYRAYQRVAGERLGLAPSPQMDELLHHALGARASS